MWPVDGFRMTTRHCALIKVLCSDEEYIFNHALLINYFKHVLIQVIKNKSF